MCNGELRRRAILESEIHGGDRAAARHWGITHGPISRARHGGNSPTLRRLWKIPKHEKRGRLTIQDPTGELTAAMDSQRGSQSREDYQRHLLALDRGELDY